MTATALTASAPATDSTPTTSRVTFGGQTFTAQTRTLKGGTLLTAHNQWASRPADQRYTSLESLLAACQRHRENAFQGVLPLTGLRVDAASSANEVLLNGVPMTWYAFGKLSGLAGAPASYLRQLPAPLAVANLRYGLKEREKYDIEYVTDETSGHDVRREREYMVLAQKPTREDPKGRVQAFTSPKYGRIWDADVVQAIIDVNERNGGIWKVPSAAYGGEITKLSTTLYAAQHNMFAFLVDGERTIEDGRRMGPGTAINRGFIVWNTEVGDRTLGIMTFLFSYVCQNRMIWGAEDVTQMLIRHTSAGPQRFVEQAPSILEQYAAASQEPVVEMVAQARQLLPAGVSYDPLKTDKEPDRETVVDYLRRKGFAKHIALSGIKVAEDQDPKTGVDPSANPYSLWNLTQGLTAVARDIPYADDRVEVEQRTGKLLTLTGVKYTLK